MPRPPKGAKTTEPLDTQGSNSKVPIHLTRSVSASAKAASDNSKDNSKLSELEPKEPRVKKRGRDPNKSSRILAKSKSSPSASKNPKKKLDNLRSESSNQRSRSKNSAERHILIPSVANRVANLEDRGEKRKAPETTPTKSPAAKNHRHTEMADDAIDMADDAIDKVPDHEKADYAEKGARPKRFSRQKLKKSDHKPHQCAIRIHVHKELNIVVPPKPKEPLELKEAQRVGFWALTRNLKVVTESIDRGAHKMMVKIQDDENFSDISTVGGLQALVLEYALEFQEGIQDHLIEYLRALKTGKWGEIRHGKDFDTALAAATQEMANYIVEVATDDYAWPKAYEDIYLALKKDTALQAELEKSPARSWEFLKLAKESFTHAVPMEDRKTLPELEISFRRLFLTLWSTWLVPCLVCGFGTFSLKSKC